MAMSKERMNEIMVEVGKYTITLANDPTVLGAKYLQDLIATCRNYTNHVARLMNEIHREKMEIDFELRRKQTAFQIAADELLANNPLVRNLPNITDRQAQINIFLKDERRGIAALENDLKDIDHVEKFVRTIHRELKDTMGEIKLQRGLIRDEIDTGRMYGDERGSEHAYTQGGASKPDELDEAEIERMLKGEVPADVDAPSDESAKAQTPNEVPSEPVQETVVDVSSEVGTAAFESVKAEAPVTEEAQVMAFLDKKTEVQPATNGAVTVSDEDFASVFDNL